MPFYVVQHQLTGRHFALVGHAEDRLRYAFPSFRAAEQRALEHSGWDGECNVYHFLDDEAAHAFVECLTAVANGVAA